MLVRLIFWLGVGWRGKAFAGACGLIGALVLLGALAPYEPYTPISVNVAPTTVCPAKEVAVVTTRVWDENWHQNIDTVRVAAQWRNVNTGAYYPAFTGPTVPNLDQPTGTVVADIRVPVPSTVGAYRLHMQYDIEGGVLLTPRHQDVPPNPDDWIISDNAVTVEACK